MPISTVSNKQTRNVVRHGSQRINHSLNAMFGLNTDHGSQRPIVYIVHAQTIDTTRILARITRYQSWNSSLTAVNGQFSFTCSKMCLVILSGLGITVLNSKPPQCQVRKNPNLSFYMFLY